MALHSRVPSAPASEPPAGARRRPLRPVAALLLAVFVTFGAVTNHPNVTHAVGLTSAVADGGSPTGGGPCWGCSG